MTTPVTGLLTTWVTTPSAFTLGLVLLAVLLTIVGIVALLRGRKG